MSELPTKINLGSGKDYRAGYLNIDIEPRWKPDMLVNLAVAPCFFPPRLKMDYFEEIIANDVLEHVPDLVMTMTNCLNLLKTDGVMKITVPYDLSLGAWSDPTHVRAFNERSWIYYTDWWWYMGWETHRFELVDLRYAMAEGVALCHEALRNPRCVEAMYVELKKVALTEQEIEEGRKYYER
jgi:SAM-dependent methyltransferase